MQADACLLGAEPASNLASRRAPEPAASFGYGLLQDQLQDVEAQLGGRPDLQASKAGPDIGIRTALDGQATEIEEGRRQMGGSVSWGCPVSGIGNSAWSRLRIHPCRQRLQMLSCRMRRRQDSEALEPLRLAATPCPRACSGGGLRFLNGKAASWRGGRGGGTTRQRLCQRCSDPR